MFLADRMFGDGTAPGVVLSVAVMSSCTGCVGSDGNHEQTAQGVNANPPVGIVEGVVLLAEDTEVPSYDSTPAPNQPEPPKSCSPPKILDHQPVHLTDGRGLENVVIGATDFKRAPKHKPATRAVTIDDCRLSPQVIAATRGDTLRLTNNTDYPFLPELGTSQLLQTLLHRETRDIALEQGGVLKLGCGFAAECGRTDVMVFYHPVHAISGKAGKFRMVNVPADEDVKLHAWHPLFEEAIQTVRVKPGQTVRVTFVLRPVEAPAKVAVTPTDSAGARRP
ncbi:MAG: hypothetical protein KC417_01410 [Myxococcales bacterium]|nr:hypothetical protein [Myxococcales bacterium]